MVAADFMQLSYDLLKAFKGFAKNALYGSKTTTQWNTRAIRKTRVVDTKTIKFSYRSNYSCHIGCLYSEHARYVQGK